jgi:hypothetical protein
MANAKYIGLVKCGLCGNENATVHEQQTGTKKGRKYYRCYSEINGSQMLCGTIQSIGPSGQDYINANMRPIGQPAAVPEPARPIAKQQPAQKRKARPIAEQQTAQPPVEPKPPELPAEPPELEPEQTSKPPELPIADEPPALPVKRSLWEILTTES